MMDDGRAVGVDQVGLLSQFWSGKVQLFLQGGGDLSAQCASQPIRRETNRMIDSCAQLLNKSGVRLQLVGPRLLT